MKDDEPIEMEVFRSGDYGSKGTYTPDDLEALAADYAAERHEAPLTFDHAQSGPAFGWVSGLKRVGDRLVATIRDIPAVVRDLLSRGAFKKRSIELMRLLPATGRPYLRAVSLLGAATPEVKGLPDVQFAQDEEEPVRIELPREVTVDPTEVERLRSEIADLQRLRRENEADLVFAELRREGVCLGEADAAALRQIVAGWPGEQAICFGQQERGLLDWLREFLRTTCPRVPLGENAAPRSAASDTLTFCERTDPRSAELHRRTLEIMRAEAGVDYCEALLRASATTQQIQ